MAGLSGELSAATDELDNNKSKQIERALMVLQERILIGFIPFVYLRIKQGHIPIFLLICFLLMVFHKKFNTNARQSFFSNF